MTFWPLKRDTFRADVRAALVRIESRHGTSERQVHRVGLDLWHLGESILRGIAALERNIMATLEEVTARLTQIAGDIASEKQEVSDQISALRDSISELKDQIAQGTAATPAQLDDVMAKLDVIDGAVKDITTPEVAPA